MEEKSSNYGEDIMEQVFWDAFGKHLGGIWEAFGRGLRSIWETYGKQLRRPSWREGLTFMGHKYFIVPEEASGRHMGGI